MASIDGYSAPSGAVTGFWVTVGVCFAFLVVGWLLKVF